MRAEHGAYHLIFSSLLALDTCTEVNVVVKHELTSVKTDLEVSQSYGPLFGDPHNKDDMFLGAYDALNPEPSVLGNCHLGGKDFCTCQAVRDEVQHVLVFPSFPSRAQPELLKS